MLKRTFDLIASAVGLVLLLPLFVVVAVVVKKEDGGPVFYRGLRVGRNGVPFRIFKFRTMVPDAERLGASSTSADDPRLTRVGRVLRKYKLDELPQLLNVLLGDMSLVGPRPQVPWAVARYQPEERIVLSVRPGITDYASLRFHNEEEILAGSSDPDADYLRLIHPEKMRLAREYVLNRSMWLDLKILFATVFKIVTKGAATKHAG